MSPDGPWRAEFESLLRSLFDEAGLRQWLRLDFDREGLSDDIPGSPISLRDLVHASTSVLLRRGLVGARLFEQIIRDFPLRRADIHRVLQIWSQGRPVGGACPVPPLEDASMAGASQALADAYEQRRKLLLAGADLTNIENEILAQRRILRHGPLLNPGDYLDHGHYRLVDIVGSGGFAQVWRAYDEDIREIVAIKVLHGQYVRDHTVCERFRRGARNMARMSHPYIVRVLRGVFEDEGYLSYVMEFVSGEDLHRSVLKHGIPESVLRVRFAQICDALQHTHDHGFVHRDIKPHNILLDGKGAPRLTDFDMMKTTDTTGGTRTGVGIGTYSYMHPDLINNAQAATPQSDVYSLGMTLLFCLSRRDLDYTAVHQPEEWLARASCSDDLKQICRRAILRDSNQQFTASEMREALRSVVRSSPQCHSADHAIARQHVQTGIVIGIDFGNTNSAAAVFHERQGKFVMIPSRTGTSRTPSIVAYMNGQVVVGAAARVRAVFDPENVTAKIRRQMGQPFRDAQKQTKRGPDGSPIPYSVKLAGKDHSPQMISAYILRDIKAQAEEFLGEPVTGAVITVPAYFEEEARRATREAGALAGLDVKSLLSEPAAAAIAFGMDRKVEDENDDARRHEEKPRRVLVYDLGGDKFDVSIIEIAGGNIVVVAADGDAYLGGNDFDREIIDWALTRIKEEHGVDLLRQEGLAPDDARNAYSRLFLEAEKMKIALNCEPSTTLELPFLCMHPTRQSMIHVEYTLTRNEFLTMIAPLLKKTIASVDRTLETIKLKKSAIDHVLLVGGSTQIPKVRELLEKHFGRTLHSDIHPEECVALGAAMQALRYVNPPLVPEISSASGAVDPD